MLTNEEVDLLLMKYPESESLIRPFLGGGDFINGKVRYCLWLKDVNIDLIKNNLFIQDRIKK
jgi:hypothetical protein